ncbi:MAG: hypothetical protein ACYTBS_26365 [Planctomycetota bacterium]|jgi:hypothetical protein
MEVEEMLKKWFDRTYDLLEKPSQQNDQRTELEDTVNASISVVENYLWAIVKLLDKRQTRQHILPAKALLRCFYQLTSRITWILMGASVDERQNRMKRLEKKSLEDELKLSEQICGVFENDVRKSTTDVLDKHGKAREVASKRIECLKSCLRKGLPSPIQILKEVVEGEYGTPNEAPSASELIPIVGWPNLHKAVHPDHLVLNYTISRSENGTVYDGDTRENIDDLTYECCVCVHRFLKEIYSFYDLVDFEKIDNEFRELGDAVASR